MQDAKRSTARRHPYRGKKRMTTDASPRSNAGLPAAFPPSAPPPRVATPPLVEPVPLDTPRFADLGKENLLHPTLLKTITEDLKFDHMMPVQAATLHELLANRVDVLAQAKTGTGKTIAFLLPAIQTIINKDRGRGSGISLLVITPTRELAQQIAKEADKLLQRFPQIKTCVAIGGTNKDSEQRKLLNGTDILIATPGRLFDHLSEGEVVRAFRHLDTLVLDEADRLLDMGFLPSLKTIVGKLPPKSATNRQGMLFSATIADHVQKVGQLVLGKDYKFISTIPKGEINTHERVPQHLITVPTFSDVTPALIGALRSEMQLEGAATFKTIVFAPTAAMADFYGKVLESIHGLPSISVLHSRVSQSKRTAFTNAFREAKSGILVATDVVARGMDFPGVTNVFQVGVPSEKEAYIHRLGRTARAGAEGRGTFIVTQPETFFSQHVLKEIDFDNTLPELSSKPEVKAIAERMEPEFQAKVYQAWLGFYKNHLRGLGWDVSQLVREGNIFARDSLGSPGTPPIKKSISSKMGLKGVKGLNIVPDPPRTGGGGRGGRAGGGGGEGRSAGSGGQGQARGGGAVGGVGNQRGERW